MRRRIDNRGFGNILTTICIVILVVCIVGIAILLYKNHKTKKEYEALREQVLSESNESSEVEEASVEEPANSLHHKAQSPENICNYAKNRKFASVEISAHQNET